MPKKKEYRLTVRQIAGPAIEMLGHAQRAAITLGQWPRREHAILAMVIYRNENPAWYAADSTRARLVITEVTR